MITALLLMALLATEPQKLEPPRATYPTSKNLCWLSSPQMNSMDEVLEYMDKNMSEWAAINGKLLHFYSSGLRWYIVYPEPSYSQRCLAKALK